MFFHRDGYDLLLSRNWNWGPLGLILQCWTIVFYSISKHLVVQKVWAILPSLPLNFYREEILMVIGNKPRVFIGFESQWDSVEDHHCAQIQIESDPRDGLVDEIDLVMEG